MQHNKRKNLTQLVAQGYNFNLRTYLNQGWEIFKQNANTFIVSSIIFSVILLIVIQFDNALDFSQESNQFTLNPIGFVLHFFIREPLQTGFYVISLKLFQGKSSSFGDFFSWFGYYLQLVAAGFMTTLLIIIGLVLFILPGFYLGVCYVLVPLLIVDRKLNFWEAMETSRQLVSRNWLGWFSLSVNILGIHLLGFFACGFGLLISIPVSYAIWTAAYRDVVG
ncbi:hypothetical protein K4A83_03000 [Spirulina subsalsa FACHB-351]|uniref:DUF975 family protein n=1 Tax=Spirulina subsalsa FACHB-351 TaxID=234711 RepID=A0ABT3L165_9CYAN|nr:hypothetical protein [Spirulina subsalsa]MCW6035241.1 hypothetical protein [Spirulina subsalsa FACHB-351]